MSSRRCWSLLLLLATAAPATTRALGSCAASMYETFTLDDGVTTVVGNNTRNEHYCSVPELLKEEEEEMYNVTEAWRATHSYLEYDLGLDDDDDGTSSSRRRKRRRRRLTSYTINLYFHVFKNSSSHGGFKNQDRDAFLDMLDYGFAGTGFSFNYIGKYVVTNDTWHMCSMANHFKPANRIGSADDLNIYLCDYINNIGYVGSATFPIYYGAQPNMDGIIMHNPEIANPQTDLEIYTTLIHEVGHWLGLFHTFHGECASDGASGDGVSDTPAQFDPSWNYNGWKQCFIGRSPPQGTGTNAHIDSCSSLSGVDEVNNFMNYIHEDCMANNASFTPGQKDRMLSQFETYRHSNRRLKESDKDFRKSRGAVSKPYRDQVTGKLLQEVQRTNGRIDTVIRPERKEKEKKRRKYIRGRAA